MGTYAEPSGIRMDFTTDEREWFDKWESIPFGWVSYITPGNVIQLHRVHPTFRMPQTSISDALDLQRMYAKEKSTFDEESGLLEKGSIVYRTPDNSDAMLRNSKLVASITHPFYTNPDKAEKALAQLGLSEDEAKVMRSGSWSIATEGMLKSVKDTEERISPGSLGSGDLYISTLNAHKTFRRFLECAEQNGKVSRKVKLLRSVGVMRDSEGKFVTIPDSE
ncbi:MAG TPA: hypothetical protein VJH90_01885 [archaeon]|nr:hypothetical protein [archaeon]